MTTKLLEEMAQKEAKLKHAFSITETTERDGKKTITHYHYLTCTKCQLRKDLNLPPHTLQEIIYGPTENNRA